MEKTVSEKIVKKMSELNRVMRKPQKPDEEKGPRPPMGPGPMGPGPKGPGAPIDERVLLLLKEVKELSKHQISLILGVPPKAIDKVLEKLEADQLVSKRAEEEKIYVSIAEKGLAKLERQREERRQHAESLFEDFTEEEKETLLTLLNKIKK